MNQNELNHLHEGENVVHRIMTRHDLQGNDIFPHLSLITETRDFGTDFNILQTLFQTSRIFLWRAYHGRIRSM